MIAVWLSFYLLVRGETVEVKVWFSKLTSRGPYQLGWSKNLLIYMNLTELKYVNLASKVAQ